MENHPVQVFFQCELSFLVGVEGQVMPILQLGQLQLVVGRRPFAGMMIPPVGEQDAANIQKQCRDGCASFHWAGSGEVWRFGFVMAWYIISSLRNGEP